MSFFSTTKSYLYFMIKKIVIIVFFFFHFQNNIFLFTFSVLPPIGSNWNYVFDNDYSLIINIYTSKKHSLLLNQKN